MCFAKGTSAGQRHTLKMTTTLQKMKKTLRDLSWLFLYVHTTTQEAALLIHLIVSFFHLAILVKSVECF